MPNKPGRKKGSVTPPNPLRDELKRRIPQHLVHRKAPDEFFQGTKQTSLKMDSISHACLDIHARRRGVPITWLLQDILNLWLAASTDYNQAIFRDLLPPNARAARCPERYPGYIDGLGFAEAPPQAPTAPTPSPQHGLSTADMTPFFHTDGQVSLVPDVPMTAIPPMPERTLADLSQPFRHPLTTGPASYPHPQPGLPYNSQLFDPEAHRAASATPGVANGAQRVTSDEPLEEGLPLLPKQVQDMLDFYRVNPEDVR